MSEATEQNPEQAGILEGGEPSAPTIPPPAEKPAEAAPAAPAAESAKPTRPDGLADEFWNDETGVDFASLLGQLTDLKTFKAEAEVQKTGVPETPEAYTFTAPEDLDLPEGMELNIADDDPMLVAAKTWAHQAGLPQEQFNGLAGVYLKAKAEEAKTMHTRLGEERGKLGENAKGRVDAVTTALNARIGADLTKALMPMMYTADQVKAMEALVRTGKSPAPTNTGASDKNAGGKPWDDMTPDEKIAFAHANARQNGQVGPAAFRQDG